MNSFEIGISGLSTTQKAFEVIGNNIANAATEGYHRQKINLTPSYSLNEGSFVIGGGVNTAGVTRLIDSLLEKEILRQQSSLNQTWQEVNTLTTIETAFGELSADGGLNQAIDDFFNSLQELSANPDQPLWQTQVVTAAETLAVKFRSLDEFLVELENRLKLEAENLIEKINDLVTTIAQLNDKIKRQEINGGQVNNLLDQRDQCISDLSELVSVTTYDREYGVVDVSIAGIPVVTGTLPVRLSVKYDETLGMGISISGENNYTIIEGGWLGGILSLKNTIISGIRDDLDRLAKAIIQNVNQIHVQGVGQDGSFTQLISNAVVEEDLAEFDPPISDGTIYIRVTNTVTGEVTRAAIDIDTSVDSLSTVVSDISGISGLNASVYNSRLQIQAESGYEFDFMPSVLPSPTNSDFTGSASPPEVSFSGIYTGDENQTLTFTVSGTGSVGNGSLQVQVTGGRGQTIAAFDVGKGYAAGDLLDIGNGIKLSLGVGDLTDGNTFEVDVLAQSDTSGLLAALRVNTFFSGGGASDMAVCSSISQNPGRIATALGADKTDNNNALKLVELRDKSIANLDYMTIGDFYRLFVTDIGQDLSAGQTRQTNTEALLKNLNDQQNLTSGVDTNEQAAQLLVFEQAFNAMAKYLNIVNTSLATMMDLL